MATPFVSLADADTDYKSPIGQDLMRQMQDNFDNLNERVTKMESGSRVLEHFNYYDGAGNAMPPSMFSTSGTPTITYPAWSVVALANTNDFHQVYEMFRTLRFDQVTTPIIYEARLKKIVDKGHFFGMAVHSTTGADRNGIWLERVDASNWRFVSYNGSRNNGSSFAKPTDNTWFTVRIEMNSSSEVKCYVDDVLKDTLVTQIPTTSLLHAFLDPIGAGPGSPTCHADWIAFGTEALVNAP